MNAPGQVLYTRDILSLAVSLAQWPMREDFVRQAELRSPSCGSVVRVGLALDQAARINGFGVDARACALGQASAAVLAADAEGKTRIAIARAGEQLAAFLAGEQDHPGQWPGVSLLASARAYPARHASILLPWRATALAMQP